MERNENDVVRHPVRSLNSVRRAYLRFLNLSPKKVDLIWINYEGIGVTYRTLNPREHYDINTFVSHPWIFRDSVTFDAMRAFTTEGQRHDLVFKPVQANNNRKMVFITLPMYSLKERCFQILRDQKYTYSDIASKEIPLTLKQDYNFFLKNGHSISRWND